MKNILLLSQFFYPDKTGTGKILAELIFSLDQNKFNTDVLASRQMYGDKTNLVLPKYEKINNTVIYRVFKNFKSKDNLFGRLFNYVSFFFLAVVKLYQLSLAKNKDIIISVSNPPIMPLLAVWLKSDKNKVVYILHDLYPDIAIKMGVIKENSLIAKFMYKINNYVFLRVDKVIVLGRDMKKYLINQYNLPTEKIEVISNWSTKKDVQIAEKNRNDKFRIIYSGNIGRFHDLTMAVEAVKDLNDVELIFIGEGAQKDRLMQLSKDRMNIKFYPFLDDNEYNSILQSADALLVSLEKNLSGMAVPSKFYTYMSIGRPIICISDIKTEMAMVIQENNCGFVVEHGEVDKFKKNLCQLIVTEETRKIWGANALKVFKKHYEKSIIMKKYEVFFEKL